MPTTEPLDDGDDEGQLKPIAQFSLPWTSEPAGTEVSPRAASQPAAPAAAEAHAPTVRPAGTAPQPQAQRPAAAHPGGITPVSRPGRHTTIQAPSLSLRGGVQRQEAEKSRKARAATVDAREEFQIEQFAASWQRFITINQTEVLLINTMRAHVPVRLGDQLTSTAFQMTVESDVQKQLVENFLPQILTHLRTELRNGEITITVEANGESSPQTWNEREVLADIARRHPTLTTFITDLNLTLS